jgi:precorrin-2 dehydrogenase/sirohydrochlorin ferrochelatase
MMSYLVNLVVRTRPALVVGAGTVAARKIAALVDAQADVWVVAPTVCDQVGALELDGRIRVARRRYEPGDARGAFVVIAATDDDEVNRRVADEAEAGGALVNVVDRPELCTFTMPAVVHRGDLTLAVATDGRCPSLARAIRSRLERQYGPEYAEVARRLADLRQRLIAAGWASASISAAVSASMDNGLVEAIASGHEARAASLLEAPFRGHDDVTGDHDR